MQGLADDPVKTHLFRVELNTLEEAISVAEQEDFSMRQAHASSVSYRPPRRQEVGGPEPMDLSYVESERPRSSYNKRLQKCNRCQKLGHHVVPHAQCPVTLSEMVTSMPRRATDVGSTLLQSRNSEAVR